MSNIVNIAEILAGTATATFNATYLENFTEELHR